MIMRNVILVLLAVIVVPLSYVFWSAPPSLPDLDHNAWWGPGEKRGEMDKTIRPFKIKLSPEMIEDLRHRLLNSREFTPPLEGVAFQYGFNTDQLKSWRTHWADNYNFTEREKEMNRYPQFKTNIQGLDIHFLKVSPTAPPGVEILPLLILHGWPGSVVEFFGAIPHLTAVSGDRNFALELIIPSLPGYGYSSASVRPNLGAAEVAIVLKNLMNRLGYKQFYLQGGDWGSIIGKHMVTIYPEEVLGFHTNLPFVGSLKATVLTALFGFIPSLFAEADLVDRLYYMTNTLVGELGYLHLQATKPDTVGVGIADSPTGLLAYILEKFSSGTNHAYLTLPDGGLSLKFSKDQLLDNVMMYWVPNSFTTAIRVYSETFNKKYVSANWDDIPTDVPTWTLQAKYESAFQPSAFLKLKHRSLIGTTILDQGGHFIALEMPVEFAKDVLNAIQEFRRFRGKNL